MKLISVLNVVWLLTVATASAGQYEPDFTGERRAGSPALFEALGSAAPVVLPSEPAAAAEHARGFTEGYNPGPGRTEPPFPLSGMADKNVFTGNKRGKVTSTKYPWSTIGRLDLPSGGLCTASLVGPDLILTNAHCVIDKVKQKLVEGNIVFRPNFTDGASTYSSGITRAWWGSNTPSASGSKPGDWAILRLEKRLGDTLGWLGTRVLPDPRIASLYAVGYSGDFDNASSASWETGCTITSGITSFGLFPHNCSNSRGASGSPMFIFEKELPYVIAMHTSEFLYDGDSTYLEIPFSADKANLALSSDAFAWKVAELNKPK